MPGFELIGKEERDAVLAVFDEANGTLFAHGFPGRRNGIYTVRELEQAVSAQLGVAHVQAVSSGSAALWCAMGALDVGPGDEVITQAFTFVATVEAILLRGATPVVVDVDESLNMDPEALEAAITPRTKLIVPVHMAGAPARMREITEIAGRHELPLLEDAAQALGATYDGRPVGTIGEAGVISLDFGKIVTCGEGGLVLTQREDLFRTVRALHDHGHDYDDSVPRGRDPRQQWGFNLRMSELQAAVAIVQMGRLDAIIEAQLRTKRELKAALESAGLPIAFRDIPAEGADNGDTLFFFCDAPEQATRIAESLIEAGIGTKNIPDAVDWHFAGTWDHMLARYHDAPLQEVFRRTGDLLRRTVAVPIWAVPEDTWVEQAAEAVVRCFDRA